MCESSREEEEEEENKDDKEDDEDDDEEEYDGETSPLDIDESCRPGAGGDG